MYDSGLRAGYAVGQPPRAAVHKLAAPILIAVLAVLLVASTIYRVTPEPADRSTPARLNADSRGVVPGEFEPQQAILIAWPQSLTAPYPAEFAEISRQESRLYCEIVRVLRDKLDVLVVTKDARTRRRVEGLLVAENIPRERIHFLEVPVNSKWIRDYGPLTLKTHRGGWALMDADYFDNSLLTIDPHEDRLPGLLVQQLELPSIRVPLGIQHGNLLSNGRGLYVTTRKLLDDNRARGYSAAAVEQVLREFYGANQVLFLENLAGEPTGHIDMFATFTAATTIVVGQCRASDDAHNSAILDSNAARLSQVSTPQGPLQVVRIPMPSRGRSAAGPVLWPTFTNVIYANGTLLVPTFKGSHAREAETALATYRRLLPNWHVVPIDATPLVQQFGSLHCATMNLGALNRVPAGSAAESTLRSAQGAAQQTLSSRPTP